MCCLHPSCFVENYKVHFKLFWYIPDPVPTPEPFFYEDFDNSTDMDLYNEPLQVAGKVRLFCEKCLYVETRCFTFLLFNEIFLSPFIFLGGSRTPFWARSQSMGQSYCPIQSSLPVEAISLYKWGYCSCVDKDKSCDTGLWGNLFNNVSWLEKTALDHWLDPNRKSTVHIAFCAFSCVYISPQDRAKWSTRRKSE